MFGTFVPTDLHNLVGWLNYLLKFDEVRVLCCPHNETKNWILCRKLRSSEVVDGSLQFRKHTYVPICTRVHSNIF